VIEVSSETKRLVADERFRALESDECVADEVDGADEAYQDVDDEGAVSRKQKQKKRQAEREQDTRGSLVELSNHL
jgi:hypothetical protein